MAVRDDFAAGEVLAAADLNDTFGAKAPLTISLNAQTGTAYTLAASDNGKLVTLSNASAITVTVEPESTVAFTAGAAVGIAQLDAGQVTITAGSGVTINGGSALNAQYSAAQLYYLDSDTWLAVGDLA